MKTYAADFETSVYPGQTKTEVWSSAFCEVGCEDPDGVTVHNNIEDTFRFLSRQKEKVVVYYHNLKFDGEFWLYYLIHELGYKPAIENGTWLNIANMPSNSYTACISDMGLFYYIRVRTDRNLIEFRDSLKLLPFTLDKIGKGFDLKHRKLEMQYVGERHAYGKITPEEMAYIKNDVLVLSEALAYCHREHMDKLTIGACCLDFYQHMIGGKKNFESLFPQLGESVVPGVSGDKYIRRGLHGGYCYVVSGEEGKMQQKGYTVDANSLYSSVMHSDSGNYYPHGDPHWWIGEIPNEAKMHNRYYFVRIRCRFKLKSGMLPTVQIKGSPLYRSTEWLKTSDVYNAKTGEYSPYYRDNVGKMVEAKPEMVMTCTDLELLKEHYDITELETIDGVWFETKIGMFDGYIDEWKKVKTTSKGAKRERAKLYLNNLYGKMASSSVSSFKVPYINEEGGVGYEYHFAEDREPAYIPVGAAITSYARDFTIRHAQANYRGPGKPGFKYSDTDSLHCTGDPSEMVDIKIHPTDFNAWKLESIWDKAVFIRQKTYIERIDGHYHITCAGMPKKSKAILACAMEGGEECKEKLSKEEEVWISNHRGIKLDEVNSGLEVPGKLRPTHIPGGVVLADTPFTIK